MSQGSQTRNLRPRPGNITFDLPSNIIEASDQPAQDMGLQTTPIQQSQPTVATSPQANGNTTAQSTVNTSTSTLQTKPQQNFNNSPPDRMALKLERNEDRKIRFESHKAFLTKCLIENVVPTGLKVYVEPSIGNNDDVFLKTFFEIQEKCSRDLMQLTIEYCHATVTHCGNLSKELEGELKSSIDDNKFKKVKETIDAKSKQTCYQLQRRKTRSFMH